MSTANGERFAFERRTSTRQAAASVGYCPQVDSVFDEFTARDMLYMLVLFSVTRRCRMARIRGIPSEERDNVVDTIVQIMGLEMYADRQIGTYRFCGRNKREGVQWRQQASHVAGAGPRRSSPRASPRRADVGRRPACPSRHLECPQQGCVEGEERRSG